jgi:endonuclease/exonuclease/phosphatase family metal-dependent hydrolase
MTDRDVILKRADLRPPAFHLSDVHANIFSAVYSLGGLDAPAGWIAATVHLGNRHFRLLTTHLESAVAGDPRAAAVQEAQAKELLSEAAKSTVPVVIAGDLNSDAVLGSSGSGPDNTDTAALIGAAGFIDAWAAAGTGSGYTWPLYAEDQFPPSSFVASATPYERIDLIFSKGLNVIGVEQVLAPASYGSDHAGVMATLQF